MAVISGKIGSTPKTSSKTSRTRTSATYKTGKGGSSGRSSSTIATTLSKSSKRMLQAAQISEKRPEILAMLDFKPLYSAGGDITLAGKMFKARVSERTQTLETIANLLKNLEETLPAEFTSALNQYTSALAATEADITLLKLMVLLREYATHTARFLDFIEEYEPPEDLDLDFLGPGTKTRVRSALHLERGKNKKYFWKYATLPLVQVLSDLPLCTYALMPSQMAKKKRTANKFKGVAKKFMAKSREDLPVLTLSYVVRDMVASYEFVKLRTGEEVDEEFQVICEEVLGSKFFSSNITQPFGAFNELIGTDSWTRARRYSDTTSMGLSTTTTSKLTTMLRTKKGILGKLKVKDRRDTNLLPEAAQVSYDSKEYGTIEALVDEAFSGPDPLNFDNFNSTVGDFITSMRNLEVFGKTMFRMGEKADDYEGAARDYALVADDMPFSLGASAAVVLDVWNRRFVDVFYASAYHEVDEYLSEKHMQFARLFAWMLIRDDYEKAYSFVSAVISDYESGFLTAAGMPEEDTDEDSDTYGEFSATSYVLPGTSTPANLSSVGTRLGSKISGMLEWFEENLYTYTPSIDTQASYDEGYPRTKDGYGLNDAAFGTDSSEDLRYVLPMFVVYWDFINDVESKGWRGAKILAAEVIDAVFEIIRALMSPLLEVEAVADGDPIFPSLTESKSPYGDGSWSFCDPAYDPMGTEMWVPTIEAWHNLFARKTSRDTYFRSSSLKGHAKNILRTLSYLMQGFDMLDWRFGEDHWSNGTTMAYYPKMVSLGVVRKNNAKYDNEKYVEFFKGADDVVGDLLDSSWDAIDGVEAREGEKSGVRKMNKGIQAPAKEFIINAHENDLALEFLYDLIGDYATRVENYSFAVQGLVEGEDSALATFVGSIREAGDGGVDLLQNLSPNQLALKQIAFEEERGDEGNAYLPTLAVLNKSEVKSVKILSKDEKAISPEGDNAKLVVVGLPAGIFEALEITDDFAIRVSYVDIEYPQIVFRGKMYPFFKDVYVSPTDLEIGLRGATTIEEIVKKMRFTKLVVEVEESTDTTASIEINDEAQRKRASSKNMEPYVNHAASEILKIYSRIMLGFNFSESALLGTSEGIQIPINDYAANLADAMAGGLETLGEFSESLASTTSDLLSDLSVIEDESFVSGELEPVDEALLTSLRDAFQTRLFSASTMRSRVLSAKLFDRIFMLAVDPDEFYIVAPDDTDLSGVTTPALILDFYLQKGIIEETGLDAPFRYKLAPRTTAEGRMAFGKFFVSIVSTPNNPDKAFE